jgi:putative endonuclease
VKYYTCIFYSSRIDEYYTGNTQDIKVRLFKHNRGYKRSTKKGIPWEVVYYEDYETRSEAYKREIEIKKRKFIGANIMSTNFIIISIKSIQIVDILSFH